MNNTPAIKFGTDGWRGIIADDFTFGNVRICAQALAEYLLEQGTQQRGVVIGYDTRFASERFAQISAEVMAGNSIPVYLATSPVPTPVVSYNVVHRNAAAAIVITASHNPAAWNGFKIKSSDGASAPSEMIAEVEKRIAHIQASGQEPAHRPLDVALEQNIVREVDFTSAYMEHISRLVDLEGIRNAGLKIVVDSMYGAGSGYLKTLLAGQKNTVLEINSERNPSFPGIQPEPIEANLGKLTEIIGQTRATVGLATDGDADRLGLMDENGVFLTQLQVYALLALYLLETRGERGAIIKTVTTTSMLYQLGKLFGVPVFETKVGFKYVAPIMERENALIGGEESGGYGFRGHIPERDGIVAALYFLDFMVKTGKTPSQLIEYLYSKVGEHHYRRVDIDFPADQRDAIITRVQQASPDKIEGSNVARIDTLDGFRFTLEDGTWLLIRFSGTEPVLRIYTETSSIERAYRILDVGKDIAGV